VHSLDREGGCVGKKKKGHSHRRAWGGPRLYDSGTIREDSIDTGVLLVPAARGAPEGISSKEVARVGLSQASGEDSAGLGGHEQLRWGQWLELDVGRCSLSIGQVWG